MKKSWWQDSGVEPERPTLAAVVPFAAVALIGVVTVFLPPYDRGLVEPLWAIALLVVALAFEVTAVRRGRRSWVDPVGPWLFFPVFVLLRDAAGAEGSGLAPLVALPILWLVLFGTRRELQVAAVLVVLSFVGPMVLVGAPDYPVSDWRRALLWSATALLVGPVMQRVAQDLIRQTRREQQVSAELGGIMAGATLSSLISTDVHGTITSFSAGAEKLLGYRAEDLVGRHDPGLLHDPGEVAAVADELGVDPGFAVFSALAHRDSPSRTWTYVRADGRGVPVQLAVTVLRDEHEEVTGYLGVAIDVSDTVAARGALTHSEERFRMVMDHLPEMTVLVLSEDLRIDLVAGAGSMRVGLGDAVGKDLREISNPANAEIVRGLVDRAARGGSAAAELNASVTGAQHEVFVAPLPGDPDAETQVLLMARDVSRDRAREREIVGARQRAERIFLDAPQGIALLDQAGVVLAANPALGGLVGRPEDELVGTALAAVTGVASADVEEHVARRATSPHGRLQSEVTVETPTGQSLHLALSSARLVGQPGRDEVLVHVQDISARRRYEENLTYLADHDPLTGLANRRRFSAELGRHVESCRRHGVSGALLLLDLDNFKEVNDTLGHSVGDELIISVGGLLRSAVRSTDVVARLGGDEFAILLTDADRAGAEEVAEQVTTRIRDRAAQLDGVARRVTASVGVVLVDERNLTSQDLMAAADMTMYDAKEAGRDQWLFLDYELHGGPKIGARMAWNRRIEAAIANDELVLHLQPIWDIAQGTLSGAEALVRLADGPELVYPAHFVYIAEMSDLIKELDGWVLDASVALLSQLQEARPGFTLEVNVSGKSIDDPALGERLALALDRHQVDPSGLVLEITETAAVSDITAAAAFAELVDRLGCHSALDDFGAGFGSFYYLKHLHFDYIKIDGEFVAHCHVNPTDRTILRAIVGIARGLGKRTVAEFVAEPEIMEVVTEEGVDFAQGHHIGHAVPVDVFVERFLRS